MSRSARRSNSASRSGFRTLRSLRSRYDRRSTAAILSIRGHVDDRCSSPGPPGGPMLQRPPDHGLRSQGAWSKQPPLGRWRSLGGSSVRCIARARPPCTGRTQVQMVTQHAIEWACSECDEQGTPKRGFPVSGAISAGNLRPPNTHWEAAASVGRPPRLSPGGSRPSRRSISAAPRADHSGRRRTAGCRAPRDR